ncbi:MAG: hypothetical protein PUF41_07175 [Prevotella copri]|nr:hypothetical protein [Segatella copri]
MKTIVFSLKITTYTYLTKQHALKGQKLLAQGNTLGCYVRKLVAL